MAITLLTITSALALHAPPQDHGGPARRDTWESLATEYEQDTMHRCHERLRSGGYQKPADEQPSSPAAVLWPRFDALSRQGDGRATVWLLQNAGADPDLHAERVVALLERVVAAEEAPWVARAVTALAEHVDMLDEDVLAPWLDALVDGAEDRDLRVAARLVRADLMDDAEAADDERLRAALQKWNGVELGEDEPVEGRVLAEGTAALMEALEAADRSWLRDNHFMGDELWMGKEGIWFQKALWDPEPREVWRSTVHRAADLGRPEACLWVLRNEGATSELEKQVWRDHLTLLAEVGLPEDELEDIGWAAASWTKQLGVDFVEPRLRTLMEQGSDEARALTLWVLGGELCRSAADETERERGLALLREVGERFPDTDAGGRALGTLFRLENLVVGKEVPDFEAVDADGNAFKLSDYRGKVTVIDFWGFW